MQTKIYRAPIHFKADSDETGEFEAVFATLNVVDHDGDVTRPGAFKSGQEVLIEPWNHNYGELPVGKGIIYERGNEAVVEGQFFLDTASGAEHYKVAKHLGPLQEWSYTFVVEEGAPGQFEGQDVYFLDKLDVWGVGQVTRGAGIGTRTEFVKRQKEEDAGEGTPEPDTPSGDDEGEGGGDALKPSGVELMRVRLDIIELEAGLDPAEE